MIQINKQDFSDMMVNVVIKPPKHNLPWGVEYMLMDSKTFMGSTGGEGYEVITEMFCNIWNTYEYKVLL